MPERIARIEELATDLWWSWHRDARAVFRRLDYALWRATAHNPVRMLRTMSREAIDAAAADPEIQREIREIEAEFRGAEQERGDHHH